MDTAKIFVNGGGQAVSLLKNYRFHTSEDNIDHWDNLLSSLELFTDDFLSVPFEPLPLEDRKTII